MKKATCFNDIGIREAEVNTIFEFPDETRFEVTYHSEDKVPGTNYFLIQKELTRILKNGKRGKSSEWLKFRKYSS